MSSASHVVGHSVTAVKASRHRRSPNFEATEDGFRRVGGGDATPQRKHARQTGPAPLQATISDRSRQIKMAGR
jgi:hypothetical protein